MVENQNNQPKKVSVSSDLQSTESDNYPIEQDFSAKPQDNDEAAMVAGVEAVGKISIWFMRIKNFFRLVWQTPKYRYSALAGTAALLIILGAWPASRYAALNVVGFRANTTIKVIDSQTKAAVSGVSLKIGSATGQTDDNGEVMLENVKLGKQEVEVTKSAYAAKIVETQIGFGTNKIDGLEIEPIGTQFSFAVIDWLSSEPLPDVKISYGENSAKTDKDGRLILNIAPTDAESIEVSAEVEGYYPVKAKIDTTSTAENTVNMVTDKDHFYLSKRSGQYDLYRSHLDGQEEQLVIPGTGMESSNIRLSISPQNRTGVLVSTRSGKRDSGGQLLKSLHIIDLEKNKLKLLDESPDIQLIDWIGEKIIYVKINSGVSAYDGRRHIIIAYDTKSKQSTELEASNHFNDVRVLNGKVYYAADDSFNQGKPKPYLYTIDAEGILRETIMERQTWSMFQQNDTKLILNTTKNGWFNYDLDRKEMIELEGQPSNIEDRHYFPSPNNEKSVWVDERDGKGVLLVTNNKTHKEDIVHAAGGLKEPVRWINNDKIIFRVETQEESADYILDLDGGTPKKINDVANVSGISRWFYY